MRVLIFLICVGFSTSIFSKNKFGEDFEVKDKVFANTAIKKYSTFKGREIQVEGKVKKVCVKKGCWMTLSGAEKSIRVTFKDYGFFVPSSLQGKNIVLKGQLYEKVENVDLQKHYLEDEGASKKEIAKVVKDIKTYHFVASGVKAI